MDREDELQMNPQNRLNLSRYHQRSVNPNLVHALQIPNPQVLNLRAHSQVNLAPVPSICGPHNLVHNPLISGPQVPNLQAPNPPIPNPKAYDPQLLVPIHDQHFEFIQVDPNYSDSSNFNGLISKMMSIVSLITCFIIIIRDGGFNQGTMNVITLIIINVICLLLPNNY